MVTQMLVVTVVMVVLMMMANEEIRILERTLSLRLDPLIAMLVSLIIMLTLLLHFITIAVVVVVAKGQVFYQAGHLMMNLW